MANEHFYPEITPIRSGMLPVDDLHTLYWEECGNPKGEPIVFIHGGPGAGATETDRRFFDPSHFRVILFDQRGAPRSTPPGEVRENTIDHLVQDIETLREYMGIDTWHVFGGSWGSTLSLYYAQERPASVRTLTIRGIWLLRDEEIQWWLYGMRLIQPERWKVFAEHIPEDQRGDLLEAYWNLFHDEDKDVAREAARVWSVYEGASCTLMSNPEFEAFFHDLDKAWCAARLESHYFRNVRLDPDDLLLQRVDAIRHIPTFIVHGRYDIVCPVASALDLHERWPESSLVIVPDAGHSSHEPGITRELVAATDRIRDTGTPTLARANRS
ncbi:MAG: prolyl aminopeptidase [Bacteroidetes bacterium]|nr:prolyl aminopeptidase [Bacteroidota bacterium]MDA1334207.1 prolyl aminopeptidase [Bacteroidota bacterium]